MVRLFGFTLGEKDLVNNNLRRFQLQGNNDTIGLKSPAISETE